MQFVPSLSKCLPSLEVVNEGVKSPGLEENFSSGLPCKSKLSKELLSPQSCVPTCSVVTDSVALWTVARQALLSRGYLRQEYWSGLPSPYPGGLADPGIEPASHLLHWQVEASPQCHLGSPPTTQLLINYPAVSEIPFLWNRDNSFCPYFIK